MIDRILTILDRYINALWSHNGLFGVVVIFVLFCAFLWLFNVHVGEFLNRLLGV